MPTVSMKMMSSSRWVIDRGSSITLPPSLMTVILPRNWRIQVMASIRILALKTASSSGGQFRTAFGQKRAMPIRKGKPSDFNRQVEVSSPFLFGFLVNQTCFVDRLPPPRSRQLHLTPAGAIIGGETP